LIEFAGVSKSFRHGAGSRLLRGHIEQWLRGRKNEPFFALRDVSFRLEAGDGMAVVGSNGAGKSTLLSLVAGLARPDQGRVTVEGRVAALLELGSGFHLDLTGVENLRLNASLLGLSRRRTEEVSGAIAGFAATPLARTSTSYSDPAAPSTSPPDTDAQIPGAVAALAARSPGKTLVLNLDHNSWEEMTGFLVQAERTGVRACVDNPHWEYMFTSQFICTPREAAAGARYYFHFSAAGGHGAVITRMYQTWVTAGDS